MQRRTWEATTKARLVLEGLQGRPVAEICNEHQISQSQYAQWCDQFLAHAAHAFASGAPHSPKRSRTCPTCENSPDTCARRLSMN
jgi:transposase-like protein